MSTDASNACCMRVRSERIQSIILICNKGDSWRDSWDVGGKWSAQTEYAAKTVSPVPGLRNDVARGTNQVASHQVREEVTPGPAGYTVIRLSPYSSRVKL
ncbi:hypothetical protein M758_6G013200 [Ceratodon purpureus]|uniref:Uncharacterized protein n=1 Tax=Ceratodon purpureus TaxID=3225 RepID=A0A8T0HE01_CERPU|nr:hypothetical protein KC19_6G015000 [Ceratodon purpureus]KAG0612248.1 hypothetical protein M758_6G013200 [Ceratodon purpureus]